MRRGYNKLDQRQLREAAPISACNFGNGYDATVLRRTVREDAFGSSWPEADLDSAQKGVRNPIPCRRLDWLMAAAEGQADVTRADRERRS